jgi:hypothetical protein
MKLVIFGLTVSSSWGNGHATTWRGLCRARDFEAAISAVTSSSNEVLRQALAS